MSGEWPLAGGPVTPVRGETLYTLYTGLVTGQGHGAGIANG